MPPPDPKPPYLSIIVRWLFVAAVVFAGILWGGIFVGNNLLPKTYSATAQILVTADPAVDIDSAQATMVEVIQSPEILLPVIRRLNLKRTWPQRLYASNEDFSDLQALTQMSRHLQTQVLKNTNIVEITATSDVPPEAANIANDVADEYRVRRDITEDERFQKTVASLHDQIGQQQKVVDDRKAALTQLQAAKSAGVTAAQDDLVAQQTKLDTLNGQLHQVETTHDTASNPVQILSHAEAPTTPSRPRKGVVLIVSGIIGVFLALAVASFTEVAIMLTRASKRM